MRDLLLPTGAWLAAVAVTGQLAAAAAGGDARPMLLLTLMAGAGLAAGASLPARAVPPVGAAAALGVAVWVLTSQDGTSGHPQAGPLGYGNANGALCAQGVAAAMTPVVLCRARLVRAASLLLAVGLVALAVLTRSAAGAAGAVLCLVVPLVVAGLADGAARRAAVRLAVAGAALVTAAAVVATVALGSTYDAEASRHGPVDRVVDRALSERRVALWSEALALLSQHPRDGVGPGDFAVYSTTARADEDARWAHSAFLQQGAETGLPGLLALVGLVTWLFLLLWRSSSATAVTPVTAVAACAAAALLSHAAIDYVLHFPVVPLLAMVTTGAALAAARTRRPGAQVSESR